VEVECLGWIRGVNFGGGASSKWGFLDGFLEKIFSVHFEVSVQKDLVKPETKKP
jgi:hypothetical protein